MVSAEYRHSVIFISLIRDRDSLRFFSNCGCWFQSKEIESLLDRYQDEGKQPSPMAKGMSWIKTNATLTMNDSDQTIASLMTDGCNMGIKSLNKYLNQYEAAEEQVKDMAKRLIHLEETLVTDIRKYL